MTLRSLRARPFDLPLKRPIETAAGIMTTSPIVLVDLLTEEGVTGHASCAPARRSRSIRWPG
jgi:mandelate racemase